VEDDQHPGRPSTSNTDENIEKVDKIVRNDRRLSVRMIENMMNTDKNKISSTNFTR